MRTSHGVVQGYNSQALTDGKHQVIIHAEAFGRGQDHAHGPPMLEGALKNLKRLGYNSEEYFAGKIFTADTNYHSETNIRKCMDLRLDAYIPDLYFRRRNPRYVTQQRYWPRRKTFVLEDFSYDEAPDQYVCPKGKRLKRKVRYIVRDGLVQRGYIVNEQDCQSCPLRPRCLTARDGKRRYLWVTIGAEITNLSKRMAAKVDTEAGRKIYPQRFAVAEPVFANIRTQKRLQNIRKKPPTWCKSS